MKYIEQISPLLIDLVASKEKQQEYKLLAKQVQELQEEKHRIENELTDRLSGMVIGEFENRVELVYIAYTNELVVKWGKRGQRKSNWLINLLKFLRIY